MNIFLRWHQLVSSTCSKWKVRNNLFDKSPPGLAEFSSKRLSSGSHGWPLAIAARRTSNRICRQSREWRAECSRVYMQGVNGCLLLAAPSAWRLKCIYSSSDLVCVCMCVCFPSSYSFLSSDWHVSGGRQLWYDFFCVWLEVYFICACVWCMR